MGDNLTRERLALLREYIHSCSDIRFWEYAPDLTLPAPLPEELELLEYMLRFGKTRKDLADYIAAGGRLPLILNDQVGLMWACAFEYEQNMQENIAGRGAADAPGSGIHGATAEHASPEAHGTGTADVGTPKAHGAEAAETDTSKAAAPAPLIAVHVLGPCYVNSDSRKTILARMDRGELPMDIRRRLHEALDLVPVLPVSTLFSYTIMLHRCISRETIKVNDFQYPSSVMESARRSREQSLYKDDDSLSSYASDHSGVSDFDRRLMEVVRTGNIDGLGVLSDSSQVSNGVRRQKFGTLRAGKDSIILFIGLCSRAAIDGGLPSAISYSLCDMYINMIEGSSTISEGSSINKMMFEDYTRRVHEYRTKGRYSREVQMCCDYIELNISENVSLQKLASITGYTEYYLSRKFRKETGMSPSAYLTKIRVERACRLLVSTEKSIQEISDELRFCSPSYFSSTFLKNTGLSPSAYRGQARAGTQSPASRQSGGTRSD